jgi:uncharacterized membrane protein
VQRIAAVTNAVNQIAQEIWERLQNSTDNVMAVVMGWNILEIPLERN